MRPPRARVFTLSPARLRAPLCCQPLPSLTEWHACRDHTTRHREPHASPWSLPGRPGRWWHRAELNHWRDSAGARAALPPAGMLPPPDRTPTEAARTICLSAGKPSPASKLRSALNRCSACARLSADSRAGQQPAVRQRCAPPATSPPRQQPPARPLPLACAL
jgi:hypothetical protein